MGNYDPSSFPEDLLDRDKVASQLGAPVDGWIPELIFRYAIFKPLGLNVDWAIMIDVYRVNEDGQTEEELSIPVDRLVSGDLRSS
ncbi:MAG: hypothetical protein AB1925_03865 [Actinomycetota bacterium]